SGVDVMGANFAFEMTVNEQGGSSTDAGAASTTIYHAMSIPGLPQPGGPLVIHGVLNIASAPDGSGLPGGNLAAGTAAADASGPNTLAEVTGQALTVVNHLSALSLSALVAA